jgi:hypothetical protein
LTFFLSLNFEFEKLGSVNFYFFDTLWRFPAEQ